MRTSTNSNIFLVMDSEAVKELAAQQTEERLDRIVEKKKTKLSTGTMWRIHNQRRGLHLRSALR